MTPHHIAVNKTARYYTLGTLNEQTQEVWFLIHGFAQLAEKYLEGFEKLDNGKRFLIAPEALNKFYLKVGKPEVAATWMTREDRENEIKDYINYLNAVYDSILVEHHRAKIIFLGFSQGVATMSRWAFKNERRIDTLIFFAGEPGNELQNRESMAAFGNTKNYFIWGTEDQFVSEGHILKFREMFPDFEFISFHGKHEINTDVLLALK